MTDKDGMTFETLRKIVEAMANENKFTQDEDKVVIGTADPSVAIKASVPVVSVYSGFDWEAGQVRIESDERIYSLSYLKEMIPDIEEQLEAARKKRWQAWREENAKR